MPRQSYHAALRQQMSGLIDQLDLPALAKQSLKERWLDQLIWADKKADYHRRWHYRLRLTTIVGGVILPALVGVSLQLGRDSTFFRVWFPPLAFGLSQIIAVSAAIEEFCRFGDRWRDYRQMAEDLKAEGWQFLQASGPYEPGASVQRQAPEARPVPSLMSAAGELDPARPERDRKTAAIANPHLHNYARFASQVESIIKQDVQSYISDLMQRQAKQDAEVKEILGQAQAAASNKTLISQLAPIDQPLAAGYGNPGYGNPGYGNLGYGNLGYGAPAAAAAYAPNGYNVGDSVPGQSMDRLDGYPSAYASDANGSLLGLMQTVPAAPPAGGLQTRQATLFKLSPQPSQGLPDSAKIAIAAGTFLNWVTVVPAENQHILVTLTQGLGPANHQQWYVYAPHVELCDPNGQPIALAPIVPALIAPPLSPSGDIRLPVPYFSQREHPEQPERTCNTYSCAMSAKFLGANITGGEDFFRVVQTYGDTTEHTVQTQALQQIGIQSDWRTDLDFDDLDRSLAAGLPIVIGIYHRGPLDAPGGGHMLVVVGRTASGDYIVNDPYGNLMDEYTTTNGSGLVYPRAVLERRWTHEGPQSGWGRLFYGNPSAASAAPASAPRSRIAPFTPTAAPPVKIPGRITAEQLIQIAGAHAPRDRIQQFTAGVNETLEKYQINTPLRMAHFLAQVMHESGGFHYVREIWGPNEWQLTYEGRSDLGNTEPGDGKRFLGRGLIQLTGRANYTEFSQAVGIDFVANPDLLEQPPHAILVAGWYWHSRRINELADRDDLEGVTRRINGGTLGMDDRAAYLEVARQVLQA